MRHVEMSVQKTRWAENIYPSKRQFKDVTQTSISDVKVTSLDCRRNLEPVEETPSTQWDETWTPPTQKEGKVYQSYNDTPFSATATWHTSRNSYIKPEPLGSVFYTLSDVSFVTQNTWNATNKIHTWKAASIKYTLASNPERRSAISAQAIWTGAVKRQSSVPVRSLRRKRRLVGRNCVSKQIEQRGRVD